MTTTTHKTHATGRADVAEATRSGQFGSDVHVADAIRNITAAATQAYDTGKRSAMIDLHDLTDLLLAIADKLDPPFDS